MTSINVDGKLADTLNKLEGVQNGLLATLYLIHNSTQKNEIRDKVKSLNQVIKGAMGSVVELKEIIRVNGIGFTDELSYKCSDCRCKCTIYTFCCIRCK